METRQRESLHALGPHEGPVPHSEVGPRHIRKLEGRLETTVGGGRQGG